MSNENNFRPLYFEKIKRKDVLRSIDNFNIEKISSFDGTEIYVYEIGGKNSETIIFSGFFRWSIIACCNFFEILSKKYRIISWEPRGSINFELPIGKGGMDIESYAKDFNFIANKKKVKSAHVISVSSGAIPAVWAIKESNFHVNSMSFFAPPFMGKNDKLPGPFMTQISKFSKEIQERNQHAIMLLRANILNLTEDQMKRRKDAGDPLFYDDSIHKQRFATYESTLRHILPSYNMLVTKDKTFNLLKDLKKMPILLVQAMDDPTVPYENILSAMSVLDNAKLILYSKGGHVLPATNPELSAKEIVNYHSELSLSSALANN